MSLFCPSGIDGIAGVLLVGFAAIYASCVSNSLMIGGSLAGFLL
ncbi:hypothetical protein CLOSTMETH_03651 [[Clostridium] methylpentosum DSM 5476]|uniref:Uncharacterized protein n=1 Tax=[Clostridium] methylpentosum DSM 5476 TaxID=537013 RepID=C0EIF6_9FIRM|nr:hypothetical protein CLOSTMETH_03651 [[Clostridium] methylpentosum DSM 5476]